MNLRSLLTVKTGLTVVILASLVFEEWSKGSLLSMSSSSGFRPGEVFLPLPGPSQTAKRLLVCWLAAERPSGAGEPVEFGLFWAGAKEKEKEGPGECGGAVSLGGRLVHFAFCSPPPGSEGLVISFPAGLSGFAYLSSAGAVGALEWLRFLAVFWLGARAKNLVRHFFPNSWVKTYIVTTLLSIASYRLSALVV